MKKYIWVLMVFAFYIFSCTTDNKEKSMIFGYDKNIDEENLSQLSFVKEIEIIPLRNNDEKAVLYHPEKIVLYGDHYYIMDNNKILCYGLNGEFVRCIGEKGHGHGEYINLASFVVYNDTIKLLDSYKNALLVYSLMGDFMYEKKAPKGILANVRDAIYEEDNTLFMSNYIYNEQNDLYTRWNTLNDKVSVVANAKVQTNGTKEFVGTHSFCNYNDNIRYVLPFSDEIMSTNGNTIKFQTSKKVLKDTELRNIHDFNIMSYTNHFEDFTGFCNIFETNNYLFLTFFNLEYTVVDKKNNECFRYSYQFNEDCDNFPLLNILFSDKEKLIGFVNLEDCHSLKNKVKKIVKDNNDTNYENIVIIYHIK